MLPKGTLAPNSGNISSNMTRAQIIKTQNKYCGKSGVVYVTGSTGHTGPTGPTGPTGTFSGDVTELNATVAVRTPLLTTYGPIGLNIGTERATSINIGTSNITTTINGVGINIGATGATGAIAINIGTVGKSTIGLKGLSVDVSSKLTVPIIDATAMSTAMTIGSNLTNGSLSIGGIQTGNISLGAGQTTGVLNIGTGLRTGQINIGTGSSIVNPIVNPIIIGGVSSSLMLGGISSSTTVGGTLNVNKNITMGSTGTIYTTLGQQIRLGYAHTQASGSTGSSFGPFFKSFGPASVTSTTYDILYEGENGLFTPIGLDGVGGLLTIVLKSTSLKMATLTYNLMKLNGYTCFQSLTAMTHVFEGWTINPTIGASPVAGQTNNIRITFNAADWSNTKVSWMFMGAI